MSFLKTFTSGLKKGETVSVPVQTSSLDLMGIRFGTDKSRLRQNYLVHYERMLRDFKDRPITLLEIGIHKGASLKLWEAYLPLATIVGVDIEPTTDRYVRKRVSIEIGSQFDAAFLAKLADKYHPDIVIEDGSHIPEHQIFTFKHLFHAVQPGGVYIAEDVRGSSGDTSAMDYFGELQREVLRRSHQAKQAEARDSAFPAGISHVETIPGVVAIWKESKDGLDEDYARLEQYARESKSPESLFYLAQYIHRSGGPLDYALSVCKAALTANPKDPWVHFEVSKILARMNDVPGALKAVNRALELTDSARALAVFREHLARLSAR